MCIRALAERHDGAEPAHSKSCLMLRVYFLCERRGLGFLAEALKILKRLHFKLQGRFVTVGKEPVYLAGPFQHGNYVRFRQPRDVAIRIGFTQSGEQCRCSQHVSHRRQLDNQDPFAKGGIVRASLAFTPELARFVAEEMTAVVIDDHGSAKFSGFSLRGGMEEGTCY